ncbi:MAG: hypothetical protein AB4352_16885 [Hormoscilla sp.]
MSAAEGMLHRMFSNAVAEYHPFADYLGFSECSDGFLIYYQGTGDVQCLAIDSDGDIVGDTTLGTKRSLDLLDLGARLFNAFTNSQQYH